VDDPPSQRSFYLSGSDGTRFHIQQCGDASVATCLFIHGFGEGGYVWTEFMPVLGPLCRTLAIDLRGHGDSAWDREGNYSTRTHLADVVCMMDALELDRCILIGHSMGGNIAIHLAAEYPLRIMGLVAVDAGPDLVSSSMAHLHSQFAASIRTYKSVSEYASWLIAQRPLTSPELLDRIARAALRPDVRGGFQLKCDPAIGKHGYRSESSTDTNEPLWNLLEKILCPVLVVRGAGSAILPRAVAEKMLKILAHGYITDVPFAGHAVMTDNPRDFAKAIYPFVEALLARHLP
jgi:pimeloyl-ACP methyl ester carboxylesterase